MTNSGKGAAGGAVGSSGVWTASAQSKAKAKKLRIVAVSLWVLGILIEIGAIFGLLLNDSVRSTETMVDDRGVLVATQGFPTWAFVLLLVLLVLDGVVVVIGSLLWKKANALDPASRQDTVRFFVQNQLGAFIPILAFLPIIVLIFLNKDMDKTQKGVAGAVGIVVAVVAALLGVDFDPKSIEEYTADKQAVVQLLGDDKVYWASGGEVYHVCGQVSDLASSQVTSGTTNEAIEAGKPRLTLKLESELKACGRAVPNNIDQIVQAIRDVREGRSTEQVLPSPDWTGVENAPSGGALDELNEVLEDVRDAA